MSGEVGWSGGAPHRPFKEGLADHFLGAVSHILLQGRLLKATHDHRPDGGPKGEMGLGAGGWRSPDRAGPQADLEVESPVGPHTGTESKLRRASKGRPVPPVQQLCALCRMAGPRTRPAELTAVCSGWCQRVVSMGLLTARVTGAPCQLLTARARGCGGKWNICTKAGPSERWTPWAWGTRDTATDLASPHSAPTRKEPWPCPHCGADDRTLPLGPTPPACHPTQPGCAVDWAG